MTTKKARDFLDKELFVRRGIVTFRSLSRELGIHVNDAKNELQAYYDAVCDTDTPAMPTYLVSGEVPALKVRPQSAAEQSEYAMDVDPEFEEDKEEDVVCQSKVLLVDARALDEAKSQFSRIYSVHIYSLSPSRFGDAGFVCTPTFKVHQADVKGGSEFRSVVGKITSPHVKLRDGAVNQTAASSSKSTLDVPARLPAKPVVKAEKKATNEKVSSGMKELGSTVAPLPRTESKDKPKPSGKLDWSKAKPKDKEPVAKTVEDRKPKVEPSFSASGIRGIKRKPPVNTDAESEPEPSSTKVKPITTAGSSVKKGVLYSDDDEDDEDDKVRMLGRRRSKRKSTLTSDSEMSLRAMMDIDDEQVDCASRISRVLPKREEEEESEEEGIELEKEAAVPPVTTEDESDHVPVIPKRRKPRKVVPVGRNGLKKRCVIKTRMTTDAKGYMQTEDYSSYESAEEEEEEEEEKSKPKGKGKARAKETKKVAESADEDGVKPKVVVKDEGSGKPRGKPATKSRGGTSKRGGLLHFFGPDRGKK